MKILFLTSSMQGGGAERVAALLSNAWAKRDHQVHIVSIFSNYGECAYALDERVKLTFLVDKVAGKRGKLVRLHALRSLMRSEQPDVIVSFVTHVNCAAILAAAGLGIPVIASERVYPPLFRHGVPWPYRILRGILYPMATALVGQTEPSHAWLKARSGNAIVATIPNPVVHPLPSANPIIDPASLLPVERKLIVWAGRFDSQKRPQLLVEVFARLSHEAPDWDVAMLGDGPHRQAVCANVHDRGLADRIILPGFAGNLADWYRRADIFVMTSAFEGFPNVLIEAMAYGVPSIAFDILTGPRDVSADGRRLLLIPDDDHVNRLTAELAALISDPDRRQQLGATAHEVVEAYSEQHILAMWDHLFARCLGSSGAAETEFGTARSE